MIFLDTSAIYALADVEDPNHERARDRFRVLLGAGEDFLTHNYVLLESIALVQNRLGLPSALRVAREARLLDVEWVDEGMHDEAMERLARSGQRRVSLVDQVSFLVIADAASRWPWLSTATSPRRAFGSTKVDRTRALSSILQDCRP